MIVHAWMTATAVEFSEDGSYSEEHGWIDLSWSHHVLFDSRNDVRPVATWDSASEDDKEEHPTSDDFIRSTVREFLGSAADNGDGTFYSEDDSTFNCGECWQDGRTWSYALHFNTKTYGANGWQEIPVTLTGDSK